MSELYSVIMTGKLVDGFDLETVKSNVSETFKLDSAAVEKLFSGKPVAIRRDIEKGPALKLRSALMRAGAIAVVKASQATKASSKSKPTVAVEANAANEETTTAAQAAPATSTPAAASANDDTQMRNITCPRCGHEQAFSTACEMCKMDLTLHIERLKRKEQARLNRQKTAQQAG